MNSDTRMDKENAIYMYNIILLTFTKRETLSLFDNMQSPGENYANENKPDTEREIPYNYTCMWNLKWSKLGNQRVQHCWPGEGEAGNGEMPFKNQKVQTFSYPREISSGDLQYSWHTTVYT